VLCSGRYGLEKAGPNCLDCTRGVRGVAHHCALARDRQSQTFGEPVGPKYRPRLENKLLAADDSWWTGRYPLHTRVIAEVPCALYLVSELPR
jgi:hypothetical protein